MGKSSFVALIHGNSVDGDVDIHIPLKAASLDEAIEMAQEVKVTPPLDFETYRAVEDGEQNLLAISTNGWKH